MSSYYNGRRLDFRQRLIPRRPVRTPIRKPITPPTQHAYIQNKLILAIGDPAFELNLPELGSSFPLASNDERTEVLECIGDGLLHSVVALEIYKRYPKATAHFVTVYMIVFPDTLASSLTGLTGHPRGSQQQLYLYPLHGESGSLCGQS